MEQLRNPSSGQTEDVSTRLDQIADAALRRFARYGYKRSSMDDIAREAGLAKATLYLHCKGKDEVFRAMLTRFGEATAALCAQVLARPAPFPEKLAALMAAHFGTGYAAFGAGEHLHELKAVMSEIAQSELVAFEQVFNRFVGQLLEEAEAAGEISLDPLGAQAVIMTLVRAAIGAKAGTPPSQEVYAERLRDAAAVVAAAVMRR